MDEQHEHEWNENGRCNICDVEKPEDDPMEEEHQHEWGVHGLCNICGIKNPDESDDEEEDSDEEEGEHVHDRNFNGWCNICGIQKSSLKSIKDHQYDIHKWARFECTNCGRKFATRPDLIRHRDNRHGNVN